MSVRSVLADSARRAAEIDRTSSCAHASASRYACADHPQLGELCGLCLTTHAARRHQGGKLRRCRACERDEQHLLPVLLLVDDGRFVVGLEFCSRCLLAATAHGRRLAA